MQKDVNWNADEIVLKDYDIPKLPDSPDCPILVKLFLQVPGLIVIPPTFFERMPRLQVLDLSNTNIVSLPTSISCLCSLEEFFLRYCSTLIELPTHIEMLTKLKLFDINGTELMFIPKEMGKLKDLEVLRISLSQYAKCYINAQGLNETVVPRKMISELKKMKELWISVTPEAEWWEEEVKDLQNELCDLEHLQNLRWYLPTNEVLQQFLLLERNQVPIFSNLSTFMLTIGHHGHLISCLPSGLEKKFEEFENCLKWISAEGSMDVVSKIMASSEALFLSHHWTLKKLSTLDVSKMKYCLLAECSEMETLVEVDGLCKDVETRIRNGENVGLELLQYLSIHYMNKLQSIWKGPIGKDSLSKLKILALHTCPCLISIFSPSIAQNLSCLAEIIVEDCPKVICLISGESHNIKYDPIFPSLERIFLLDLPELVNIFDGLFILEKLHTLLIYNCFKLRLSVMELPHIKNIEGEIEWWNDLDCDKSPWENVFVPLKEMRALTEQLSEATNSLEHFHRTLSDGTDEKKLSNLTDMREQVITPDTRRETGEELFFSPEGRSQRLPKHSASPIASDLAINAKEAFFDDDFELAADFYSQAILVDPQNSELFSDRAQKVSGFFIKQHPIIPSFAYLFTGRSQRLPKHSASPIASDLAINAKEAFFDDDFELAADFYSQAILVDPQNSELFSDRAQVNIKLKNFTEAVADANKAIELDPSNSKAFLRKGTACFFLEEYQTAKTAFEAGSTLAPKDTRFTDWIKRCDECIAEDAEQMKDISSEVIVTPPKPKYRHEFYQKPDEVIVTIFAKGISANCVSVNYGEQILSVTIDVPGEDAYVFQPRLFGKIVPTKCRYDVLSTKVEILLAKAESVLWTSLEFVSDSLVVQWSNVSTGTQRPAYPSSKPTKHWDKFKAQVKKEEKDEKLDGDAALNKFFREIYKDADNDTRRAMRKSFVESSGTVLSTNWKEVGSKMVEGTPPDVMEMKKWEY